MQIDETSKSESCVVTSQSDFCINSNKTMRDILALFDIEIPFMDCNDITLDSRQVVSKGVFVALPGANANGKTFIDNAIENGATLILKDTSIVEHHGHIDGRKSAIIVSFFELDKHIGQIASEFFGNPSFKMHGVAITGTNGKTSVAHICASLSAAIGCSAGSIGTMGALCYHKATPTHAIADTINTTPDVVTGHRLCGQLKTDGANRFCIEASSHGLHQQRLQGLSINTGVFTNLTLDHLDYHQTFAAYAKAKRLLIKHHNMHSLVLNIDDAETNNWLTEVPQQLSVCLFSRAGNPPEITDNQRYCWAKDIRFVSGGCSFELQSSWGSAHLSLPLIGAFNVSNLLASIATLLMQGESFEALIDAVSSLEGVPGRMELFVSSQHANIIVDYAHTPDALKQALLAARQHTIGKLWVVFGCGGDRDTSKRAQMGKIAEQWADKVVVTQDNSRFEDPQAIISDVLEGISGQSSIHIELDRKIAIKQAYMQSGSEDLILVAGKGHEEYIEIEGVREYYNERNYVNKLTSETII